MKRLNFLPLLFAFTAVSSFAQVDTLRIPDHKLTTGFLKPGRNQFLVVMQNAKSGKSLFLWYWLRDIKLEERNGIPVFTISQHWYGSDTLNYRLVYSINRRSDFGPIYHSETIHDKTNAYNWNDINIISADSVTGNNKKGFSLDFDRPNMNWNLDIETFEMLPLGEHKVFAINFYDAGLEPPKYIMYRVTGSEMISYAGQQIDCWKLYTEGSYKAGQYKETYWISKKDHEFLVEEDEYGEGLHRTKVKMPVNMDLLERFKQPQ